LGLLRPVIGEWVAESETPSGTVVVTRRFEPLFGSAYVRAEAHWEMPPAPYDELALFGEDPDGKLRCWSFTSDGRQSVGVRLEADDVPEGGFAFVAEMPAGLARQLYWPVDGEPAAFGWAVEARAPEGWNRFTEHVYRRV
jgi:hypothetical protein